MSDFQESIERPLPEPDDLPKKATRPKSNSRFSRLVSACGLTHPEAAAYLGLSKSSVAMKAASLRPMFKNEEDRLLILWKRIVDVDVRLDGSYPFGARRMQHAIWELRNLEALADGRQIRNGNDYDVGTDVDDDEPTATV